MMDRRVIKHLALVPTPVEKKKLEDETARLEAIANASADKYLDEQINKPQQEKQTMSPIPKNVATILGLIATAGLAVSAAVPPPWSALVSIVSFVLAGVAGLAVKPPHWAEGRPLIQGGAVTLLGSAVPIVAGLATSTSGWLQLGLQAVALVLAFLTGTAAPSLEKKAETPPAP